MEEQNLNLHDDFFKVAFSRLDVIQDYITQFLDKKLVKNIDFQSLTLTNNSYTTGELKDYFADIVWDSAYGTSKTPIKITFLFEHKSFVPKYPHLQLLRYLLEIWEDCEKNKKPLTPIIPIIVYHNKNDRHWKYKPFTSYFKGIDANLEPFIPTFDYQLTDLTTMSEEQILAMQAGLLINSLLTLQFGSKKNFVVEKINTLLVNVKNVQEDEHFHTFFFAQLVYILKNNELSPEKVTSIIHNFKNTVKMNAYDSLLRKERKEAKFEGRQEGKLEGRQEGKLEGKLEGSQEGKLEGKLELSIQVIKNILAEFPQWDNEKIANLANSTVEMVKKVRAEINL